MGGQRDVTCPGSPQNHCAVRSFAAVYFRVSRSSGRCSSHASSPSPDAPSPIVPEPLLAVPARRPDRNRPPLLLPPLSRLLFAPDGRLDPRSRGGDTATLSESPRDRGGERRRVLPRPPRARSVTFTSVALGTVLPTLPPAPATGARPVEGRPRGSPSVTMTSIALPSLGPLAANPSAPLAGTCCCACAC
jgi:hypothetical protein